jgi:hypothetical protein
MTVTQDAAMAAQADTIDKAHSEVAFTPPSSPRSTSSRSPLATFRVLDRPAVGGSEQVSARHRPTAGLANFAASIATFGCTSLSSNVDRPFSHVTVQRKGILTPETSR